MKGFKLRLNRPTESFVYSIFGALVLTAGVWLWAQSSLSPDNPVPSLMMKIHGAAAMAALILLGALLSHIRRGWTAKKNRLSGVTLLAVILFLILTGYGLYYAGDEQFRAFISRSHTWIGFGLVLLIPGHVLLGRALRRKKRSRSNRDGRGACLACEAVVSKAEGEEGASSHRALVCKGARRRDIER